jgi:hypothetical protein
MRRITLFLFAALAVTSVDAASYQQIDGTIVNPILDTGGNVLAYSGNNLEASALLNHATLTDADLTGANLYDALLSYATLSGADLTDAYLNSAILDGADLTGADLTDADLTDGYLYGADLGHADLTSADLHGATLINAYLGYATLTDAILTDVTLTSAILDGADLTGSDFSSATYYEQATWSNAFYYTDNEPTWASGMNAAWQSSAGILALAPVSAVPEPATLLLALLGLALLPRRRRR